VSIFTKTQWVQVRLTKINDTSWHAGSIAPKFCGIRNGSLSNYSGIAIAAAADVDKSSRTTRRFSIRFDELHVAAFFNQ
jgi:hypothetical protein